MTQDEIVIKLTEHDGRIDRHEGRIKALEAEQKNQRDLVTSVAVMASEMKTMNEKLGALSDDVQNIKARPAKRWEAILLGIFKAIGYAAVSGLLAYIALRVGG